MTDSDFSPETVSTSETAAESTSATAPATTSVPERAEQFAQTVPGAHSVGRTFAELTTLRIGGAPAAVIACATAEALHQVVAWADQEEIPNIVVGGGSNLVVGEGPGVQDLLVIWAHAGAAGAQVSEEDQDAEIQGESDISVDTSTGVVRAFAGVVLDELVEVTVAAGLGGLECLSGIPGSVGATPVQNVGAYGAEVSQTLRRVQLYERSTGRWEWVDPESLDLDYRYSNLKFTNRAVVTAVEFQLSTDGLSAPLRFGELARRLGVTPEEGHGVRRPVAEVREAVLALRAGKGMVLDEADHDTWSAGSFFTNPIVVGRDARDAVVAAVRTRCSDAEADSMPLYPAGHSAEGEERFKFSAAWLIERAGFSKGWHVPGNDRASLSTKHTLALTNRGGASSEDVVELARAVRDGVREAFGVVLEPEPIWLGATL
ncbi:UDP-N-acetylmuramate dehydrogenase [Corynebacterium sp. 320]|uniref:UDP-N-acetylmuramate dehydrogenase n=1 Tax=Corynebacterium zhongnanshanii TaxID=2768834 RepID=UPI00125CB826|nr:UDP-N-acetylmuramate dehydrogenase [Corynebacterium sp. 320]KAB1552462.1 UDP-N-acetylmuramate dehydrogenase [Corynebacterium sp. 321]KAB1554323.1 UDP-N-acetylmuramate dehydrogenase [Corynebacterium sp. 319]KAB3528575.1 UDP-N-acetylmuramate dehydrogenase [Corynebacterium sp. 250]KAB3539933.1 UDP-N-acetylmuramate dehydrogenase [Corynebacterium sp. 366]QNP92121.1 UDP-N-acetylmuramate dehydrogenase [Corynebacterium zhongnanshanii]